MTDQEPCSNYPFPSKEQEEAFAAAHEVLQLTKRGHGLWLSKPVYDMFVGWRKERGEQRVMEVMIAQYVAKYAEPINTDGLPGAKKIYLRARANSDEADVETHMLYVRPYLRSMTDPDAPIWQVPRTCMLVDLPGGANG